MENILVNNFFEKKGQFFVRTISSKDKPELKAKIVVMFKSGYWKANVQFYNSKGACGIGDFQYKNLKVLMNKLSKECGYCGF